MTRLQQVLIGLLALQLVLAGVVFWPRGGQAAAAPLFGDLKAEDISSLTITDDRGVRIKLAKNATGWVLPEADDFPADSAKITPIVTKLAGLKSGRSVAQTESSHARLQVADASFVRRLEIGTAAGTTRILYIGSNAGGRATHVRLSGSNDVYIANDLSPYDFGADAGSWINAMYISQSQGDVVGLTLSNAHGQWVFEKDAEGQWTMAGLEPGEALSTNNLSTILSIVTSIRMVRPLGKAELPEYGLAQPSATAVVKMRKDGEEREYTLTIGARDEKDNTYVVKSSDSPYYVRVANYTVNELVERSRANFLQPTPVPPTPAS